MKGIGKEINKTNGDISMQGKGKIEIGEDRLLYEIKTKSGESLSLSLPKYEYLERIPPEDREGELLRAIKESMDYLFDKYPFDNADKWAFLLGMIWYAYFNKYDYGKIPSIGEIEKVFKRLYPEKIGEIKTPDVANSIASLFDTLEANKGNAKVVKGEIFKILTKYNVEEEDITWFYDYVINSLKNYINAIEGNKREDVIIIPISKKRVLIYDPKRGIYYQDVKSGEETPIISMPFEIYKIIDLKKVGYGRADEEVKYYVKIDDDEGVYTNRELRDRLIQLGVEGLKNSYSELDNILTKIFAEVRKRGKYFRVDKNTPIAPGVYVDENDNLQLYLTMEDGIVPISKEHYKALNSVEESLTRLNKDNLKKTMELILKIIEGFDTIPRRVNIVLALAHAGISPFYYVLTKHKWMMKHLILQGVKGAGKSLKGWIVWYAYGPWYRESGGRDLAREFVAIMLRSLSTFPLYLNDVDEVNKAILSAIKSSSEGKTEKRGTPSQKIIEYPQITSMIITANSIDWQGIEEEGVSDRLVIGRYENERYKDEFITLWGEKILRSDLRFYLEGSAPWGFDYLSKLVKELNEASMLSEFGRGGAKRLLALLSKLKTEFQKMLYGMPEILSKIGDVEGPRFLELLAEYYFGLNAILSYWKTYYSDLLKEYYENLTWLFELKDKKKFLDFIVNNWLAYSYNFDILKGIVEKMQIIALSSEKGWEKRKYEGTIEFDESKNEIYLTSSFLTKYAELNKGVGYKSLKRFSEELAKAISEVLERRGIKKSWYDIQKELVGKDLRGKIKYMAGRRARVLVLPVDYLNLLLYEDLNNVVIVFTKDYEGYKAGELDALPKNEADEYIKLGVAKKYEEEGR